MFCADSDTPKSEHHGLCVPVREAGRQGKGVERLMLLRIIP